MNKAISYLIKYFTIFAFAFACGWAYSERANEAGGLYVVCLILITVFGLQDYQRYLGKKEENEDTKQTQ